MLSKDNKIWCVERFDWNERKYFISREVAMQHLKKMFHLEVATDPDMELFLEYENIKLFPVQVSM